MLRCAGGVLYVVVSSIDGVCQNPFVGCSAGSECAPSCLRMILYFWRSRCSNFLMVFALYFQSCVTASASVLTLLSVLFCSILKFFVIYLWGRWCMFACFVQICFLLLASVLAATFPPIHPWLVDDCGCLTAMFNTIFIHCIICLVMFGALFSSYVDYTMNSLFFYENVEPWHCAQWAAHFVVIFLSSLLLWLGCPCVSVCPISVLHCVMHLGAMICAHCILVQLVLISSPSILGVLVLWTQFCVHLSLVGVWLVSSCLLVL